MPDTVRRHLLSCLAVMALIAAPRAAAAADPVLLTVVDTVTGTRVELTRARMDALAQHVIATATDFTEGTVEFRGPLATDILAAAGAGGAREVKLIAANDYSVTVPAEDFRTYGVVMATEMNGKRLSLRDRGPVWVMYPLDDFPELRSPRYVDRLIWQLVRVEAH